jgi:predicted RNA methylase
MQDPGLPRNELALARIALDLGAARKGGALSSSETRLARRASGLPTSDRQLLDTVRDGLLAGVDPLGTALLTLRPQLVRQHAGMVYTPAALVAPMISWAVQQDPARLVDPGCGSGRYSIAAAMRNPDLEIVAIDTDPVATLLTRAALAVVAKNKVTVINADYTRVGLAPKARTAFVGNPPYVRHHRLDGAAKQWLVATATKLGHEVISTRAGLHAYFFMATACYGRPGDIGCFLTSSEWLDTNYGWSVRHMLLNGLGATSLHLIDPQVQAFRSVNSTGLITCFRLGESPQVITISAVHAISDLTSLEGGKEMERSSLQADVRWTKVLRTRDDPIPVGHRRVKLGSMFRIRRGIATGANGYFVMTRKEAAARGLMKWCVPVITRGVEILDAKGLIKNDDRLKVLLRPTANIHRSVFPRLNSYLAKGEHSTRGAERVKDRYLCGVRSPWWLVELPEPAPVVSTYMARRPPAFVLNPDKLAVLNIGHYLWPRMEGTDLKGIVQALNKQQGRLMGQGRVYQGGLEKFEPHEMAALEIDLPIDLLAER